MTQHAQMDWNEISSTFCSQFSLFASLTFYLVVFFSDQFIFLAAKWLENNIFRMGFILTSLDFFLRKCATFQCGLENVHWILCILKSHPFLNDCEKIFSKWAIAINQIQITEYLSQCLDFPHGLHEKKIGAGSTEMDYSCCSIYHRYEKPKNKYVATFLLRFQQRIGRVLCFYNGPFESESYELDEMP